jgi:hypothetical protein
MAIEAMARAIVEQLGFDPDEILNDGKPRWLSFVPSVQAALDALIASLPNGAVEAGAKVISGIPGANDAARQVITAALQHMKGPTSE